MKRNLLDAALVELPPSSSDFGATSPPELPKPAVIPSIGSLDSIELPMIVKRVGHSLVKEELLDASEGLETLTLLAIDKAIEILRMDPDPGDDNYATDRKAQVSIIQGTFTTQARVDEGRFKKKQADKMGELLDLIKSEEAKLVDGRVLN